VAVNERETSEAPAPPGGLAPGDRVGDYVVHAALASGGYGAVYSVEHTLLGVARALKVLHSELFTTRAAVLRFEREVEVIRRIRHPHVVDLHDVGRLDDGRPWFAMELLAGEDLGARLARAGRLPPGEVLAILEPLASALDAVHAQGVLHRDLKPSNVFLAERDGAPRVVLLDFGVAKVMDAAVEGLTRSGEAVGTLGFMAPETLRGQLPEVRTDVYALGALLYTLLVGEPPFRAAPHLIAQLHLHARPRRPSARAPVDPAFDEVVLRALSKDPAGRQASAGELLAELRRAAGAGLAPGERRMAAVHIEVQADPDALEDPDESLLVELDGLVSQAAAFLAARGFRVTVETGNAALFVLDLDAAGAGDDRTARRGVVEAALALQRSLAAREGADARVRISLCLHVGPVQTAGGAPIGGALLDVAAWVPEPAEPGIVATREMLVGLAQETEPAGGALLRLVARRA
jgi:tRNA A-37 threonylcarbamoyl transferase component Bud32